MLQIKHKKTGELLLEIDDNSLSGKGSSDKRFVGVDLQCADLKGQYLFYGDYSSANLEGADLSNAELGNVSFNGANLRGANLRGASVWGTSFDYADLSEADLVGLSFRWCSFEGAKFNSALLLEAAILECSGLGSAHGLESARTGSLSLDRATLVESISGLSSDFLIHCGYTSKEIDFLRNFYAEQSRDFPSCFVSHAELDLPFALQLIEDLRKNNVPCWHYKNDLLGGRSWLDQIKGAIKSHEKLVLVCSRNSIYRPNVVTEILTALEEQQRTGVQKLFPIRLDGHILTPEFLEEAREKVHTNQWADNWVPQVQKLHILDFSHWNTEPGKYEAEFQLLLKSLRVP